MKQKADGTVNRFKARLVAKGFTQQPGIDYEDTFSPVAKSSTIRLVFAVATQFNWPMKQLDINNTFLHNYLNEPVYVTQPPGLIDIVNPTHACRLSKSLYGLKQAPRAGYERLRQSLLELDITISPSDSSLFIQKTSTDVVIVLIYVDNILLTGSSTQICQAIIIALGNLFPAKDLGDAKYFLSLELHRTNDAFYIT